MPSTNFPFGVNATTSVRTVAGEVYCNTLSVVSTAAFTSTVSYSSAVTYSSTVTVGSGSQMIGQTYYMPVLFGTASALEQKAVVPGFANCSLDAVFQTVSAVSALVANYTVQVGSAGAVAVATVANTTQSVGVINSLTTSAVTFDGTASALVCVRSVQGTTGETSLTLVVRRTA